MAALEEDPEQATLCLQAIYDRAGDFINAGLFASTALDLHMPFERGQFTFIRLGFHDDWQPRGAIEASMVDTLAQCYVAWQYWLTRLSQAANNIDSASEQIKNTDTMKRDGPATNDGNCIPRPLHADGRQVPAHVFAGAAADEGLEALQCAGDDQ